MALPSTIYRASIQLSDLDRGRYESLQFTLARHPSETAERLLLRLLAYALCHEPELVFTKGVGAGDEPDLWAKEPDGRISLWVEVGLPDPERLIKASRHAGRVILFCGGLNRVRWEAQHLAKLSNVANLSILAVGMDFLTSLGKNLQRSIQWELTLTEGRIYLSVDGQTLETDLELVCGQM